MKLRIAGMALAALCMAAPAAHANLLANGSFETGDFSGWTVSGDTTFTGVVSGPFYVYSGAQDGNFYVVGGSIFSDAFFSQTFADTAGQKLLVTGWMNAVGDVPSDFGLTFDGNPLTLLGDPNTGNTWTEFSFLVTATGSDTFTINSFDLPAYIAFDNFSITAVKGAVPEPGSLALLGAGLAGLGGWRLRRKAKAA